MPMAGWCLERSTIDPPVRLRLSGPRVDTRPRMDMQTLRMDT